MKNTNKITAIIVTYHPNKNYIQGLLNSLKFQVDEIIIIDNSDCKLDYIESSDYLKYVFLDGNKGIAHAQNIGFIECIKNDSKFAITFDQDSKVNSSMIIDLLNDYNIAIKKEINVACIGPLVINDRNNNPYDRILKNSHDYGDGLYSVKSLISSGCLYPIESILKVGLNKSEWFIDAIDIEWCYRATYKGYSVIMSTNTKMLHNLGESDIKLLIGKTVVIGAPFRLYYIFRNCLLALREPSYPIGFKFFSIIKIPIKILFFSMIAPRRKRIKYIFKGLLDGILNRPTKIE